MLGLFCLISIGASAEVYLTIKCITGTVVKQCVEIGGVYKYHLDNDKNGKIVVVTFNGKDVTADVIDGNYTTPKITGDSEIYVEYDNQPLGDTNLDGVVNVNDITATAAIILGGDSPKDDKVYLKCPDDHHPHIIDLGLPSGTKWCCCNVGATTPEGYGGYYAWGETSEKSVYNGDTYAYYNSNTGSYTNIGSDIAGSQYDVTHVRMGAPWRMPSTEQQQELIDNCTRTWTQQNGVNGTLVTGKNGGQIFLPAAGYRWNDYLSYAGSDGYYWSSSLGPYYDYYAYNLYFGSGGWNWFSCDYRSYGRSVRAVCP